MPVEKQVIQIYAATQKDETGQGWIRAVPDRGGRPLHAGAHRVPRRAPPRDRARRSPRRRSSTTASAASSTRRSASSAACSSSRARPKARCRGRSPVPSLRDIRNRIGSVKSTRQITKAMKMVVGGEAAPGAGRHPEDPPVRAAPRADARAGRGARGGGRGGAHPLLAPRVQRTAEVVVITSDRGLAGGFNSNIARRAQRFLVENADRFERIQLATVGRKGRDYFRARRVERPQGLHRRPSRASRYEKAEAHRPGVHGALPRRRGGRGLPRLQRVQERHLPDAGGGPAAPHRDARPAPSADGAAIDFMYEPSREALLARPAPAPRRDAGVARAARVGRVASTARA